MPYKVFSLSRPGQKYAQRGFRCQDSSGNCTKNGVQIVAVADGHGANDCFRSEIGASIAIDTLFCEALPLLYDTNLPFSDQGIRNFKYKLWQSWREAVKKDWDSRRGLDDKETRYEFVSEKYKQRYQCESDKYLYTAYGTTLIAAIAIESELLLLQIGDGSAVVLCADGLFTLPVPRDEENYLNVTTSLSEDDADQKIRHAVLSLDTTSCTYPVAVFLSSDGVDDCFPTYQNEEYLFNFYKVLVETAAKENAEALFTELNNNALAEMSAKGSHDDISLGIMMSADRKLLNKVWQSISLPQVPLEPDD
ncbi:protein phosphatase 2C domain-containing protein [Selenomonas sp. AB3002]|uniref:protein phosphatase 2C domain-containing protein n=1 Tax=Selenomonas sp. AB3002 TaxID=1392502 RepID=UPI000497348D